MLRAPKSSNRPGSHVEDRLETIKQACREANLSHYRNQLVRVAHISLTFYRGKQCEILSPIFDPSRLSVDLVSKRNNISEI